MALKEYASADGAAIADAGGNPALDPDFYRMDKVRARIEQAEAEDTQQALAGTAPSRIAQIPLRDVQPSPFNPRKSYNEQADKDLDESVRQVGIMQPVLVRPVPLPIDPQVVGHYELVYGHRRFYSAQRCELETIPAQVRLLTDDQVAQMQAIENLQREDITVMEEARGYAEYIRRHGITKDQLALQIGKSRTYVYNRLKLATLVAPAAKALEAGAVKAEVATLIARVPEKLQDKALVLVTTNHPGRHGEPAPFRWARDTLLEAFSLDLKKDAIFDTADANLVPSAGPCTTCPMRSGCSPEIYGDVVEKASMTAHWLEGKKGNADACMDPDCFASKKKAHLAAQAKALEAKGKFVVSGSAAKAALGSGGEVKGNYVALSTVRKALNQIPERDRPKVVTILDQRTGKAVEAVKRAEIATFGADVAKAVAKPNRTDSYAEQRKKDEAEATRRTADNRQLLTAVRAAAAQAPRSELDLRIISLAMLESFPGEECELLAQLHGHSHWHGLKNSIEAMAPDQLALLLLDFALVMHVEVESYNLSSKPEYLLAAAAHYGVKVGQGTVVATDEGGEA